MTLTKDLDELIEKSGYKYGFIAEKLGISYQALRNKLDNKTGFWAREIHIICKLLNISDYAEINRLFFAPDVPSKETEENA